MIQLRPGDLIAVRRGAGHVLFAILTKQIMFGGHWSFVFHKARESLPSEREKVEGAGFNAIVDFIVPKREDRVVRISRENDFKSLLGPELLQNPPAKGEKNYRIWRWTNRRRADSEFVRATPSPTEAERTAPHGACMQADYVWELADREWNPSLPCWGG